MIDKRPIDDTREWQPIRRPGGRFKPGGKKARVVRMRQHKEINANCLAGSSRRFKLRSELMPFYNRRAKFRAEFLDYVQSRGRSRAMTMLLQNITLEDPVEGIDVKPGTMLADHAYVIIPDSFAVNLRRGDVITFSAIVDRYSKLGTGNKFVVDHSFGFVQDVQVDILAGRKIV